MLLCCIVLQVGFRLLSHSKRKEAYLERQLGTVVIGLYKHVTAYVYIFCLSYVQKEQQAIRVISDSSFILITLLDTSFRR